MKGARVVLLAALWFVNGAVWTRWLGEPPPVPPVVIVPPAQEPPHKRGRSVETAVVAEKPPAPAAAAPVIAATIPDTAALQRCLTGKSFAGGKLLLRVSVSSAGAVQRVSPVAGDFLGPSDERCLTRALRSWRPPSQGGEIVLTVVL